MKITTKNSAFIAVLLIFVWSNLSFASVYDYFNSRNLHGINKMNGTASAQQVGLSFYFYTSQTQFAPGSNIELSFTVSNFTQTNSDSSSVRVYISQDSIVGNDDQVLLPYQSVPGIQWLSGKPYYNWSKTAALPSGLASGTYTLIAVLNPDNVQGEAAPVETFSYVTIQVVSPAVDLVVSSFDSVFSYLPGQPITAEGVVTNAGSSASPASSVGVFISSDSSYSSEDVFFGEAQISALAPHTYNGYNVTASPVNIAPGKYFFIHVADYKNLIQESNESNNVASEPFRIVPATVDISFQDIFLSNRNVVEGDSVVLTVVLTNRGTDTVGQSLTGIYLTDQPSPAYQLYAYLGRIETPPIAPGEYDTLSLTFVVPAVQASGTYQVTAFADINQQVPETNEQNNASASIFITKTTADLVAKNASLNKSAVMAGQKVKADFSILNNSDLPADNFYGGFYLSVDTAYSPDDVLLAESNISHLNARATKHVSASLQIPQNEKSGNYYILFVADSHDNINESLEVNNSISLKISIQGKEKSLLEEFELLSEIISGIVGPNPIGDRINILFTRSLDGVSFESTLVDVKSGNAIFLGTVSVQGNVLTIHAGDVGAGIYELRLVNNSSTFSFRIQK